MSSPESNKVVESSDLFNIYDHTGRRINSEPVSRQEADRQVGRLQESTGSQFTVKQVLMG